MTRLFVSVALVALLASCAADTDSQAKEMLSDGESVHGVFSPDPDPPRVGENTMLISLMDAEDMSPVLGAALNVQPWMPHHGHGSPRDTTVTEIGDGTYEVEIFYQMGGDWELRVGMPNAEDSFVVPQTVR